MGIEKTNVTDFLHLTQLYPVIDVRSPGEYIHAYFPGAYNLPLFNDEERRIVGTTYKQQSRQDAIKIGLDFFGVKMKKIVQEVETLMIDWSKKNEQQTINSVLVHCWRGGMRSAAVAWLLDMYGYKVYTLAGGYKSFRNWVLKQWDKEYSIKILGGYTGSGKTALLQELKLLGQHVIDMEKIANHKGSAFGAIGEEPQPSQEMFENLLALHLFTEATFEGENPQSTWIEDESQRIGRVVIPATFWEKMRKSPVYFLDIPFDERLNYLVTTYGNFEKEKLAGAIERIQKRLGGLETKNAIALLSENNIKDCFSILLKYYDKLYLKGLHNRKDYESLLNIIACSSVNTDSNLNKLCI